MAVLCERPKVNRQSTIVETRGLDALRLRLAAAQNGVAEAKQLRGGEIIVSQAMQHLNNLIASPGGLKALQSLPKEG